METKMNEIEFEAKLRADGYSEIETQDLLPRPAKGQHGHPFSIRGSFSLAPSSSRRTISEPYTGPDKSSPSTMNIPTTNRSVPKARACSLVANTRKSEPSAVWFEVVLKTKGKPEC